jgi:hypothetical protein
VPEFIARVELFNVASNHPSYERLHQEMTNAKFYRFMRFDGLGWRDLPTGTYESSEYASPEAAAAAVSVAATKAAPNEKHGILISSKPCAQRGLKE